MEAPNSPKQPTDDEIVSGYLANYAGDQSAFWAFEETCELLSDDPERLWLITLRLIEQAPDDAALAYVAAGPLEDILAFHGPTFIERVEDWLEGMRASCSHFPVFGVRFDLALK